MKCQICNEDNTKLLFIQDNFHIVKCRNCGFIYVNSRFSRESINKIYDKNYFCSNNSLFCGYDNYLGEKDSIIKTFRKRFESIEKLKKPGRLLDIGCAAGFLLKIAEEKGWEAYGLEISEYIANYGIKELGVKIYQNDLLEKKFDDNFFDVVVLWDVIEHLIDLQSYFKEIYRILKKDGIVSIITPDVSSIPAKLLGKKWVEFKKPKEHIYFFSKKILIKFLQKNSFVAIKSKMVGKIVSLEFAIKRLQTYNKQFFEIMEPLINLFHLEDIYLSINPCDKIMIIARKM